MSFKYACVLIECPITGRYLGVSRKDDWNDFGLAGGKVEKDEGVIEAAVRELREEAGIVLKSQYVLQHIFDDGETITFKVSMFDIERVEPREPGGGVVDWVNREQLCGGSFGGYNTALFKALGKPVEEYRPEP